MTQPQFKVGDKVCSVINREGRLTKGKTYDVLGISPFYASSGYWVRIVTDDGRSDDYWNTNFELVNESALDKFKTALDNLRDEGYDVTVTVTHTVTEEL
jgi:hypothetical protein